MVIVEFTDGTKITFDADGWSFPTDVAGIISIKRGGQIVADVIANLIKYVRFDEISGKQVIAE